MYVIVTKAQIKNQREKHHANKVVPAFRQLFTSRENINLNKKQSWRNTRVLQSLFFIWTEDMCTIHLSTGYNYTGSLSHTWTATSNRGGWLLRLKCFCFFSTPRTVLLKNTWYKRNSVLWQTLIFTFMSTMKPSSGRKGECTVKWNFSFCRRNSCKKGLL